MSLRSLGYVLTRRFYPRKIYSLHAGFLPGIVGPLFAAAFAGGLGILIFKKHPGNKVGPVDNNVTNKCTKEEVRSNKPDVTDNKPTMQVNPEVYEQEQALDLMMEKVWMIMKEEKEKKGASTAANDNQ